MRNGESLGSASPLINLEHSDREFLTSYRVSEEIRWSLRPRFGWRPYIFRAYFDTQMLVAESKGLVPRDFRSFWMGHHGTIEATYTVNKGRLPENLLEEMRNSFRRAEPLLDLERNTENPMENQRREAQAAVAKLPPDAVGQVLKLIQSISGKTQA